MNSDITGDIYQAYCTYCAIKLHFGSKSYDYFKYHGKIKSLSIESFKKRKDRRFFYKLSRQYTGPNLTEFLVANFTQGNIYVGDLFSETAINHHTDWRQRVFNIYQVFEDDLNRLDKDFITNLKVVAGQNPPLLSLHLTKDISLETLCIMGELFKFYDAWSQKIIDPVIWPHLRFTLERYHPFLASHYLYNNIIKIFSKKFDK
jgi:hypothetical protein